MTHMPLPADGGCRCGRLRFRLAAPPMVTLACHCTGCQRMTASAFSLTVMVAADGFALTAGEPVAGGLHAPAAQHWHCPHCLSWTHTSFTPSQGFVNVRATMLDDVRWFTPFIETMAAEKLPWVELPVRRSYAGWPPPEDFPAILSAFAA